MSITYVASRFSNDKVNVADILLNRLVLCNARMQSY